MMHNLLNYLSRCDHMGNYSRIRTIWPEDVKRYNDLVTDKYARGKAILDREFEFTGFYWSGNKTAGSKANTDRINPRIEFLPESSNGSYTTAKVTADLGQLFGLPGESQEVEFRVLKSFFYKLKSDIDVINQELIKFADGKRASDEAYYSINNSTRALVQESIEFNISGHNEFIKPPQEIYDLMKMFHANLLSEFSKDKAIQSFMRYTRRYLNSIGPHSWISLGEIRFHDQHTGPVAEYNHKVWAEHRQNRGE